MLTAKLIPEKPTILLNEPIHLSFILHNPTNSDLYIISGGDPDFGEMPRTNRLKVFDAAGNEVPQVRPQFVGGSWIFGPHKIPAHSSFIVTLFLPESVTFTKPGTYSIVVRRQSVVSGYNSNSDDKSIYKLPAREIMARTTLIVEPADSFRLGKIIDTLGNTLVSGSEKAARFAGQSLTAIKDRRVVPYFARAFDERKDAIRFAAVEKGALDKYDDPIAFTVLQKASKVHGTGKDWANDPQFSEQEPDNIRFGAALALSRSPYHGAIPFLITRRHDSSSGVRLTVVQAMGTLGETDPKTAIPILLEMKNDKDRMIRNEARRYLKSLSPSSPQKH